MSTQRSSCEAVGRTAFAVVGAAVLAASGLGWISDCETVPGLLAQRKVFAPDRTTRAVHDRNYRVFKRLYDVNRDNFARLNTP